MKKVLLLSLPAVLSTTLLTAADKIGPAATAENLFHAMATHDVAAARALFTPEATLTAARENGTIAVIPREKWLQSLESSKETWLERMWNTKVLEHGPIAAVWGDYDFHRGGAFSHCGIDSFALVKSEGAWKIAGITFTTEKNGCVPSPLGPPSK